MALEQTGPAWLFCPADRPACSPDPAMSDVFTGVRTPLI